eukprot:3475547-Pleurochrysis_carterae.AAC.6
MMARGSKCVYLSGENSRWRRLAPSQLRGRLSGNGVFRSRSRACSLVGASLALSLVASLGSSYALQLTVCSDLARRRRPFQQPDQI